MPNAVAGEAGIRIAVIFAPVRAEGAQIIAQFFRRDGKKGTQHMPPVIPGAHAAERPVLRNPCKMRLRRMLPAQALLRALPRLL